MTGSRRRRLAAAVLATSGYVATVPAANWLTTHYPAAPVAPGVMAPAGVYAVGLTLVLRDFSRELAGRTTVAMAMAGGVILSSWTAGETVATASAAAYALSECLDFVVYERLRAHGFTIALALSNAAGLIADSLLFLSLAFGSLHYLPGQVIGKTWMTGVAVVLLLLRRHLRHGGHLLAYGSSETVPEAEARPVHRGGGRCDGFGPGADTQARPQPRNTASPKAMP
ncbi:VUT family protein [Streptomyces sp. NPDC046909]|uniref:VUT family protein n=1 Tax=Streptomyces sp. NPDC046909 TaxID=3155617 RepID=UPI0033D21176